MGLPKQEESQGISKGQEDTEAETENRVQSKSVPPQHSHRNILAPKFNIEQVRNQHYQCVYKLATSLT